jgi:hypothetical protein
MAIVTGTVASKARNGTSIKIGEDWFGSFKGKGLEAIEQGHSVQVDWDYDKTGKYKNIKTVSVLGGAAVARPAVASSGGGGYSNLGVELGHASKLAMDLALAMHDPRNVGDDDFYADWIKHTRKVYKAMTALRAEMSKPVDAPAAAPAAEAQEESIF